MTVAELIKLLSAYNTTDKVVVKGYEGGYLEVAEIARERVVQDDNQPWYEGDLQPVYYEEDQEHSELVLCLYGRKRAERDSSA